jgi:hypothetical protein
VTLAQRVRRAGARLEVDGSLQQAVDPLHLHFDCAAGDAPLVSAAHGAIRPCASAEGDATRDALLVRFGVGLLYCYWGGYVFSLAELCLLFIQTGFHPHVCNTIDSERRRYRL